MSTPAPVSPPAPSAGAPVDAVLRRILMLPLQILATGGAILLLLWVCTLFRIPGIDRFVASLEGNGTNAFVAVMIFFVGLSFAVFLWWVVDRYYVLIRDKQLTPESLASLKDLPLGLPEGTVRSILALIVAIIGLPLLLFSHALNLGQEISGYINGIIAGVFGYYFGSRSGSSSSALRQVSDANDRATLAQANLTKAQSTASLALAAASDAARAAGFGPTVDKLTQEVGIGSTLLDVIAPALPKGILPAGLSSAVTTAKSALDAVQGVTASTVTDSQQQTLTSALGSVLGSGGTAGFGSLLSSAIPMLSDLSIPGLGPLAALAVLVSVGAKLGSAEYQRWRARVLAAPLAHGLIEFGTVTPDQVHAALDDAPIFAHAFAEERDRAGFDAKLADDVLRDDALDRLWKDYGVGSEGGQPPLFTSRGELEKGLNEFNQVLLASHAASDITPALASSLTSALADAQNPAMRPGSLSSDTVNQIIDAASKASAAGTAPTQAHAAFDALVTLVGNARQKDVDLVGAMKEMAP